MVIDPMVQDISSPRGNIWPTHATLKKCTHLMLDMIAQSARDGLVTLALNQMDLDHG